VTSEEAERILTACRAQGAHPAECQLLNTGIDDVRLFQSGTSETFVIEFSDGSTGAFKSIEGADRNAAGYGHTGAGVLVNDFSAWLVARGLKFEHLVGAVVITVSSIEGASVGSLQVWLPGDPSAAGWETSSRIRRAALFDAVIGQQDRNGSNFNYDAASDEIGLFDNSFAFAVPGAQRNASEIVANVHAVDAALDDDLFDALDALDGSDELQLLEEILEPQRFDAFVDRIDEMRTSGTLLPPLEF
jgi:hypothetical protein